MLSKERHHQHRSFFQSSKLPNMFRKHTSGALSPETIITSSSGYSTGGSSISTSIDPSLKNSSSLKTSSTTASNQHQQYKNKSKGLQHLFTKLKNFLVPSAKTGKKMRSTTRSREISSTNRLRQHRQQSPIYDAFPSLSLSSTTNNHNNNNNTISNNPISLPFVYYQNAPTRQSRATYDKISAWLNHTEKLIEKKLDSEDSLFSTSDLEQSRSSLSSLDINHPGINIIMKKTPTNIKPPKRSSSLVSRITRPIIEQQTQKTITPSSSFSSSILMRGMSERMTPPPPPQKMDSHLSKLNRPRKTDFSRRRTVAGTNEYQSNKENRAVKTPEKPSKNVYQFPLSPSNNKVEIHIPPSKHLTTKKYYFQSNVPKPNEDLLNNSYGLTLLSKHQPKHSNTAVILISQIPHNLSSQKRITKPRTSIPQPSTLESLDDLLCDREVESYFYPTHFQSEHVYMNLENPPLSSPVSYFHGTLC